MPSRAALDRLFEESVALYLRLNAWAADIYGRGDMSGPRRTILTALARTGPQTVADMARARAQSRQRIQPLVHALHDEGLVDLVENPAHRRSPLVVLTKRGRDVVADIVRVEADLRGRLRIGVPRQSILAAAAVLRLVRETLDRQAADLKRPSRSRR